MPNQNWNAGVQIVQSIYEGGKLVAALKSANATKQQALAQYQTVVADTLLPRGWPITMCCSPRKKSS